MKKSLAALLLLVGCGGADRAPDNRSALPAGNGSAPGSPAAAPAAAVEPGGSLVGLYEGGRADRPNQLCMVEKAGKTQFGVVVWGAVNSCAGAGDVERDGAALKLKMTGDSPCTIEAAVAGGAVTFRSASGSGCEAYYCGHGARFEGASFTHRGATEAAAKKATDIAGDPLCG